MTEDLVKRVAKAIADNIQVALPSVYVHSIDYESAAHAAIEAIREHLEGKAMTAQERQMLKEWL
jgi:hypothetical protein